MDTDFDPLTADWGRWGFTGMTTTGNFVCCGASWASGHHPDCPQTPIYAEMVAEQGEQRDSGLLGVMLHWPESENALVRLMTDPGLTIHYRRHLDDGENIITEQIDTPLNLPARIESQPDGQGNGHSGRQAPFWRRKRAQKGFLSRFRHKIRQKRAKAARARQIEDGRGQQSQPVREPDGQQDPESGREARTIEVLSTRPDPYNAPGWGSLDGGR